jgi:hypothetical protein
MKKPIENWKQVPGHANYRVSDLGNVWSLHWDRPLKTTKRKHGGHLVVTLDGRQYAVHRLVLLAFVGPPPNGMEVCHEDGDPENNRLSNLRYDTHFANVQDRRKHGTHPRGVDLKVSSRFTEDDIRTIRRLRKEGMTYQAIANRYGLTDRSYIRKIISGRIWGWVDNNELATQSRKLIDREQDQ